MSGMIERVARAIAFSSGSAIVGPGQSRATREFGWSGDGGHFQKYVDAHWRNYVHAAEFAISAMREPTEAMVTAAFEGTAFTSAAKHEIADAWRQMVAVARSVEPAKDIAA